MQHVLVLTPAANGVAAKQPGTSTSVTPDSSCQPPPALSTSSPNPCSCVHASTPDAERTPVWLMRQAGRYMAEFRAYSDKYPFRMRSGELSRALLGARPTHTYTRSRGVVAAPGRGLYRQARASSNAPHATHQALPPPPAPSSLSPALPLPPHATNIPSTKHTPETPEIAIELSLQPWRAFKPDGVIFFSDILTPLPALGIEFDVIKGKGPRIDNPIRSMEQVAALRTLDDPTSSLPFVHEILSSLRWVWGVGVLGGGKQEKAEEGGAF